MVFLIFRAKETATTSLMYVGARIEQEFHHINVLVYDGDVKGTFAFRIHKFKNVYYFKLTPDRQSSFMLFTLISISRFSNKKMRKTIDICI